VSSHTVAATTNVLRELGAGDALRALQGVLELDPDLVGLQEWHPTRYRLLAETGPVDLLPGRRRRRNSDGYHWTLPILGGCVVGARGARFRLVNSRSVVLSGPARADHPDRWMHIEPPRVATVATYDDLFQGRTVSLICYHLAPGVQVRGRYREDRPLLVARHQLEVNRLQSLVDERLVLGHAVYAVGDSNFDGLRLSGITSAWEGRDDAAGTLGPRRKVDDVHGPGSPIWVRLVPNESDHKAVVACRLD
jgi:endonuclease/exonuclease/phosphatase family metal-dependent hydrolase